jgi:high-affinity iron transporter
MHHLLSVSGKRRLPLFILTQLVCLLLLFVAWPAAAQEETTLPTQLQTLAREAMEGAEAAKQNETAVMHHVYDEVHEAWQAMEDGVQAQSPTAYIELEGALATLKTALEAEPINATAVGQAFDHLAAEAAEISEKLSGGVAIAPVTADEGTVQQLMDDLNGAYEALEAGEVATARELLTAVITTWPSIEGAIATQDSEAYTAIEIGLSRAAAALDAETLDVVAAETAVGQLRDTIAPFATGASSYTMFDAMAIILREGLEALLVITALLTFLKRSGNADKQRWIWMGSAVGIGFSLLVALALQSLFNRISAGQNRELIEGITGLLAAAMLFYVSYWLHNQANLRNWQKYINESVTQALDQGRLMGLATLAFLAVFREGAETAVFYLGIAPSISLSDLLLGLGLGLAILAVVAGLMFGLGLRLPLRPFFFVAGLLVYYLGFKFLGTGIHSLQVANVLPASPLSLSPIPLLGFYPTWQTAVAQLLMLLLALFTVLFWQRLTPRSRVAAS